MKKNDDPAVLLPNKTISGGNIATPDVRLNSKSDNTSVYQIDRDVFDHLPKMYQKMAAVFAASGKVVIVDNSSRGSHANWIPV